MTCQFIRMGKNLPIFSAFIIRISQRFKVSTMNMENQPDFCRHPEFLKAAGSRAIRIRMVTAGGFFRNPEPQCAMALKSPGKWRIQPKIFRKILEIT
jgi:hypothetical protein